MVTQIDGQTRMVGLLGWPVSHSLSPAMHNAAFDALDLNWCYVPLPVPPGQIEAAVRGLAALGFRGANVTTPHKQAVIPALDSLDRHARALGAVNTLVVEGHEEGTATTTGHNTDAAGFIEALRQGGFEPLRRRALVVGAGGAARAVVYGLLQAGSAEVIVLNRSLERAQALVHDLASWHPPASPKTPPSGLGQEGKQEGRPHLRALPLTPETLLQVARSAELLVNATTLGMWPHVEESIWPADIPLPADLTVFDLVYNPLETRLLRQARRASAREISGLGMLVRQGALAFMLWTGHPAPVKVMQAACLAALRR